MELESYRVRQYVTEVLVLVLLRLSYVSALKCHNCNTISNPAQCTNEVSCYSGEVCSVSRFSSPSGVVYNLSCATTTQCQGYFDMGAVPMGRRDVIDPERCFACCHGDNCNVNECQPQSQISRDYWSQWSPWTPCSKTCQGGNMLRGRQCTTGEGSCPGPTYDKASCNDHVTCQDVDTVGQWSVWQEWSPCPATCGSDNVQVRDRTCRGHNCQGSGQDIRFCNIKACPVVSGQWSVWSNWSDCSVTCGAGTILRSRTCSNPPPGPGGAPCANPASFKETKECERSPCPVDGQWSAWLQWSSCSVSCDGGISVRYRWCSNPTPAHGGRNCAHKDTYQQLKNCTERLCAVDGQWSDWSPWTSCSATCGQGEAIRVRSCTDPAPQNGGKACMNQNSTSERKHCTTPCPQDGHWSDWSSWSKCSATCGTGTSMRVRTCSKPLPAHGGQPCSHPEKFKEIKTCHESTCKVVSMPTSLAVSTGVAAMSTPTVPGCSDHTFCQDSHIAPLACNDTYVASTYCPKLCGICGPTVTSSLCADNVGSKCQDPLYRKFACADEDLAVLCAKSCGLCH